MNYLIETYGCQMNTAESASFLLVLKERGWVQARNKEDADLVLINTCSVRATAERRVRGRIAQYEALKRKRPFTLIIAGCMASRLGDTLKTDYKAVDYVMGTASRPLFPHILEALEGGIPFVEDTEKPAFSFAPFHLEDGRFCSFIPITHGCDNFCSYCVVPYVRGPEISRDPAAIFAEIRLVAEKGAREIMLLGQNVNSYYWDGGSVGKNLDFPRLLEAVAAEIEKTPIRWIRFLSSHPKDLSTRVIRVMADRPAFCRHLHLCAQHGSNAILRAMNRRYSREQYLELVDEIRGAMPDITFSTDMLIGFPGEMKEDHAQTLDLMERVRFLYAYMYHYNPREGTPAFEMPGRIGQGLKRKRLGEVIALQKQHTLELLQNRVGSRETVLVEGVSRRNAEELLTRTERDERVVVPGKRCMIGSFAELTLESLWGNTFRAKELSLCPGD
ncbi:MAG: tRNA (N6-isopentenyl adenosine(37)-C2)-methylthiotransferase MiaB [Spirochaetaceae bacterium]|jgi:tRNA-2-methylthio-N6-dimethylallyladenosine synthase|nr:tRNA (N6-isopentenyl adenosine(37)-C2)-methylthiotransferase MiaB [Spirochaetaceae bacterium]